MKAMISELMLYDASPEDLLAVSTGPVPGQLAAKLQDVALIYRTFRERLENSYMTAEEVPDKFCEAAGSSALIRGSVIALDGFTGFTPIQLRLIEAILPIIRDLLVTVTMDPERNPYGTYRGTDLFLMGYETAHALLNIAKKTKIPVEPTVTVERGTHSRLAASPSLSHLERQLFRNGTAKYAGGDLDLSVVEAANPRKEVEEAARRICRLMRREGLRCRDIAIVTGDLSTYGGIAREILGELQLPYFIDEKRSLMSNPFIEYLRAAAETCAEDYSYDAMFRMLKTGMTDLSRDETDRIENYALGVGLKGRKRWQEDFIRAYRGEDPGEVPFLNGIRRRICDLLNPLAEVFTSRRSTVREKSAALYEFCVRSRAEEKLRAAAERFDAQGRPDLAREYAQVYPYVMSFLDKLVAVLGNERISMNDYTALLEAGFAEARIAIIPPGSDRIFVGDVERSRIPDVRALFFLGMNEGLIPKPPARGGILTELDRERLAGSIELKPPARKAMYIERFYLYTILAKASERLIVSYSTANTKGEALHPAYLIGTLRRMFPRLLIEREPREIEGLLERREDGFHILTRGLAELGETPLTDDFLELLRWYRYDPAYAARTERLLRAAGSRKIRDEIGQAAARALYGTLLYNSASRLERFCECEFRHFLDYGLRLRERPSHEFTGLDMGNIIHRSLELYAEELLGNGDAGASLSAADGADHDPDASLLAAAGRAYDRAVVEAGGGLSLHSSARGEYQIRRMKRILEASVRMLGAADRAGEFRLHAAEMDFRNLEDLASFRFELPGGARMVLRGRIDRIDTCESGAVTYVRVVDYKTGSTTFDLAKIYHGMQLQLAIYMNAGLEMLRREGRVPVPAGMFYFRIQDPVLDYKDEGDDELRERRMKKMQPSGVILDDAEAIRLMDRETEGGVSSKLFPVRYNRGGTLSGTSSVLAAEDMKLVGGYAAQKAARTGAEILKGRADVNPYSLGTETACDYCPFRAVCGFDPRVPGYEFRELGRMKKDEVLRQMSEDLGETAED